MFRSSLPMINLIEEAPVYSFFLDAHVKTLKRSEFLKFYEAKGTVVKSGRLPDGRKVQILIYGLIRYAWIAGFHEGEPTDDFPVPVEDSQPNSAK